MTPVTAWLRLDLRRRWRSLLVMALLVAIAAGTVMTAVAGARRGATAVDRLLEPTLPATVAVLPNEAGFDWDAVRAIPEVEAVSTFVLTYTGYVVEELPPDQQAGGFPPVDDEIMRTIERPVILEGRLPDPARADEVVISPAFEERHGLGVGDAVTLRLFTPESQDTFLLGEFGTPEPDGPVIPARIVGVIRSQWFSDAVGDTEGGLQLSPGLFAQYEPNLMGASGGGQLNGLVRLRGGAADMADFQAGLERVSGRRDIDMMNLSAGARQMRDVTGFEATALLAFAFVAGLAAVFLVGQSVARYSASTVSDLHFLQAVGMTPGQVRRAATGGPALAAVAGVAVGAAGSVAASRWFPIGTAAVVEPAPGTDVDPLVLVAGLIAVPVLVVAGAALAAWSTLRSARWRSLRPRSSVAAAIARAGAPVPVVVGARFALEPGRGRHAVPVRSALTGAVVGVLGVVAAFTFSDGVEDATANPARFGQVHQLEVFAGLSGEDFLPVDEVLPIMAADPDVAAVNDARVAVAEVKNVPVTLFTLDSTGAPWQPVMIEGRVPDGPAEVVLAPASAEAMDVAVGDRVALEGTLAAREVTVTGLAFVPEAAHNDYVTGGWVTSAGYDTLFDPDSAVSPAFKYHVVMIALRPDADPDAVAARIGEATGGVVAEQATPPSTFAQVQQIRTLPVFLAGFLVVLALGAVGHALATAVRRRQHDVAVLRAVGMTPPQSRGILVTQASLLALAGLLVGVPLGIALGRTVWRYVAETTPLFYVAPVAVLALVLVVPVALVAANLLAAWPSHRAASMSVGHVLRAE